MALKYINKAIEKLEIERGVSHYYMAVAHRAQVYLELNRTHEAKIDLEILLETEIKEVVETRKVIQIKMLNLKVDSSVNKKFLDTKTLKKFEDRELSKDYKFSKSEQEFLRVLVSGSVKKHEIIHSLYGKSIDFESAENRLRVLYHRFNKKAPNIVIRTDEGFQIVDDLFIPKYLIESVS